MNLLSLCQFLTERRRKKEDNLVFQSRTAAGHPQSVFPHWASFNFFKNIIPPLAIMAEEESPGERRVALNSQNLRHSIFRAVCFQSELKISAQVSCSADVKHSVGSVHIKPQGQYWLDLFLHLHSRLRVHTETHGNTSKHAVSQSRDFTSWLTVWLLLDVWRVSLNFVHNPLCRLDFCY